MKELSVFIDESGDFGNYNPKAPFYIISIVLHEQNKSIMQESRLLEQSLKNTPLERDFIHVGPLLRKEEEYKNMTKEDRIKILRRLINFSAKVSMSYKAFYIEKKHTDNEYEMIAKLAKELSDFLRQHYPYFLSFDIIKLYYDNGQSGVLKIILSVFTSLFENVKYKKSSQSSYKLLQVADLICTAKLIELKMRSKSLSRSERYLLGSVRDINKNLFRYLKRKEFN
ncbi:DUF3800 domain-containing protein [Candidatus Saccharibacteria bacterium]|nr:DUF3800 domain-containing protein [Candidatus Saccharibacteria bacterium]